MMPTIDISQRDFERLQSLATPFFDTPATVVARLLDNAEQHSKTTEKADAKSASGANIFFKDNLPPLSHTRFVSGDFAGKKPIKAQWNSMVETALVFGLQRLKDVANLHQACGANLIKGKKLDQGYAYLHELDFSYQRVSANDAAKIVTRLASAIKVDAYIEFEWRDKPDAFKPLESGRIVHSTL